LDELNTFLTASRFWKKWIKRKRKKVVSKLLCFYNKIIMRQ
jgi:hypothetical protein